MGEGRLERAKREVGRRGRRMLLTAAGGLFLLQWLLARDVQKTCQVHSGSVSTDCDILSQSYILLFSLS